MGINQNTGATVAPLLNAKCRYSGMAVALPWGYRGAVVGSGSGAIVVPKWRSLRVAVALRSPTIAHRVIDDAIAHWCTF